MWQVLALSNRTSQVRRVVTPPLGSPRRSHLLCAHGMLILLSAVMGRSEPVGGETFSARFHAKFPTDSAVTPSSTRTGLLQLATVTEVS